MAHLIVFMRMSGTKGRTNFRTNFLKISLSASHHYHSIIVFMNDSMLDGTINGTYSQD
jgi:hypothetical protein